MKKVIAEITSFRGFSIGAMHYYLSMHYRDNDGEYQHVHVDHKLSAHEVSLLNKREHNEGSSFKYKVGMRLDGYLTIAEAKDAAIKWFKTNTEDYDVLLLGRWGIASIQECLYSKDSYTKEVINSLYRIAERMGRYEGDPETMDILDDAFLDIINS